MTHALDNLVQAIHVGRNRFLLTSSVASERWEVVLYASKGEELESWAYSRAINEVRFTLILRLWTRGGAAEADIQLPGKEYEIAEAIRAGLLHVEDRDESGSKVSHQQLSVWSSRRRSSHVAHEQLQIMPKDSKAMTITLDLQGSRPADLLEATFAVSPLPSSRN